jgi:predicted extracellular nuclease
MRTRRLALFVGFLVAIGAVPLGSPQKVEAVSPNIVISQIYGGAGCTSAPRCSTYKNDYIELFNRGTTSQPVNGWSVQYAAQTGTSWQVTALSNVSIPAGGYYLVGEAFNNNGVNAIPDDDATGTISMSGTTAKIALVNTTTPLTGRCGNGATLTLPASVVDFVGYGTGADCNDSGPTTGGAGNAPAPSTSNATFRAGNGCTDTDANSTDFAAAPAAPRNSQTIPAPCGGATPSLSIDDVSQAEGNAGTTNFTFTVTLSPAAGPGGVTFDIATADGTAQDDNPNTEDDDYVAQSLTGQTIASGGDTYQFTVTVNGDTDVESDETFTVDVTNITGANAGDTQGLGTIEDDDDACGGSYTPIHDIQGNSTSVPVPAVYTTEGIVTGDFEGTTANGLQGFWIQEPTVDADPNTSEGIFVYTGDNASAVSVGQRVRVQGYARERFNETTINGSNSNTAATTDIQVCTTGNGLPAATTITLPLSSLGDLEKYEGMRVQVTQSLVISEYFEYARFGEIVLALPLPGEPRPFSGTALDEPGAAANARTAANLLRRIRLDDGLAAQNPEFLRHPNGLQFTLTNRFRGGDTVQNAIGVLGYNFSNYKIEPTAGATYTETNPRPSAPNVGGDLQVAAMNTLNFFISTGNTCGPTNDAGCRGWNDPGELQRQRDKLVAAIGGLDAEIVGLNELENSTGVDPLGDAQGIVPALNAAYGPNTYAYINTGVIGTDAIKVGLVYKPANVTPVGSFSILDSSDDPRFIDTKSRPVLAQTFEDNATGGVFTVAVVHLKSKGSACDDIGDVDDGDGQGNCDDTRQLAAEALVDWLDTDPTNSGDGDFIIVGDMNSYARENSVDAVKLGSDDTANTEDDFVDLHDLDDDPFDYSYDFDGQFGYLDHALAIKSLAAQVTESQAWHINADEPNVFDYDTSFKGPQQEALYEPNAFRSSDHDPVVTGLDLLGCNGSPFNDVSDEHPFCEEIDWAKDHGITFGYSDGGFHPMASITRQAMAAFLARLSGDSLDACVSMPFNDVPITHPFCEEIKWMADNGISTGYEDGTYRPMLNVTRQAMAAFLQRMVGGTLEACPPGPPYSDVPDSSPFCDEIKWLHDSGITNGFEDGTYRPLLDVTRQAMAAFLYRTSLVLPDPV